MKKALNTVKMLVIALILLVSTGCIKYNTTMEIKSNKSMTLTTIYAVESSILEASGATSLMTDEEKEKLIDKGYTIEDYSEGTMVGYKISISVPSIDFVSDEGNVEYDLSSSLDDESEEIPKIFKVEKGLLKNKYVAHLTFSTSNVTGDMSNIMGGDDDDVNDENLTSEVEDDTDVSDEVSEIDGEDDAVTDDEEANTSSDDSDFGDLANLLTNLDLSFTVKLPCEAISNNATKTENEGKTLIWTLSSENDNSIDFEFELYNYLYIGIMGGAVLLLIVLIIIIISKKKKGKKVAEKVQTTETAQAFITEQPVAPVEVPPMATAPVMTSSPAPVAPVVPIAPAQVAPVTSAPVGTTTTAPVIETPVVPATVAEPVLTSVSPVVAEPVLTSVSAPVMETAPVVTPVEVTPITAQPVQIDVVAGAPVQPVKVAPVADPVAVEGADNGSFQMQPVQIDVVAGTPIQPIEVAPVQPIEVAPVQPIESGTGDVPQA